MVEDGAVRLMATGTAPAARAAPVVSRPGGANELRLDFTDRAAAEPPGEPEASRWLVLLEIPSAAATPPEGAGAADAAGVEAAGVEAAGAPAAVTVLAELVTGDAGVATGEPLDVLVGEPFDVLTGWAGVRPEEARCLSERREPLRRPLAADPATEAGLEELAPAAPGTALEPVGPAEPWRDEGPPFEGRSSRNGPLPARERPPREDRPGGSGSPPPDPPAGAAWELGDAWPCAGGTPLPGCDGEEPLGESLPRDVLPAGEAPRTDGDAAGAVVPGW